MKDHQFIKRALAVVLALAVGGQGFVVSAAQLLKNPVFSLADANECDAFREYIQIGETEWVEGVAWWNAANETGSDYKLTGNGKWKYEIEAEAGGAFCVELVDDAGRYITTTSAEDAWYFNAEGDDITGITPTGNGYMVMSDSTATVTVTRQGADFTVNYLFDDDTEYTMVAKNTNIEDSVKLHFMAQVGLYNVTFYAREDSEAEEVIEEEEYQLISEVEVSNITAPSAGKALETWAYCGTTGVSNSYPTVYYTANGVSVSGNASYDTVYTASVTLYAKSGYEFSSDMSKYDALFNGGYPDELIYNSETSITLKYTFGKTQSVETIETSYVPRMKDASYGGTVNSGNLTSADGYESFNSIWFDPQTFSDSLLLTDRDVTVTLKSTSNYAADASAYYGDQSPFLFVYSSDTGAMYGGGPADESYEAGVQQHMVEYCGIRGDGKIFTGWDWTHESAWDGSTLTKGTCDDWIVDVTGSCGWGGVGQPSYEQWCKDNNNGYTATITAGIRGNNAVITYEYAGNRSTTTINIGNTLNKTYICLASGNAGGTLSNISFQYAKSEEKNEEADKNNGGNSGGNTTGEVNRNPVSYEEDEDEDDDEEDDDEDDYEDLVKARKTSITVKAVSATEATIKWKKSKNATGYILYRSTSKYGKYKKIKAFGEGTFSYTDKKLSAGKTYYYKVLAYNTKTSYGTNSSVKKVTLPKKPSSPGKLSSKGMTIYWSKVKNAGKVEIIYNRGSGKYKVWKTLSPKATKYTFSTSEVLQKMNQKGVYYIYVRAYKVINGKKVYGPISKNYRTMTRK